MAFTKTAGVVYGTPEVVLSTTAAAGSKQQAIRIDGQLIAFSGDTPEPIGTSAATGSAAVAARLDHVHTGMTLAAPALTLGTANSAGGASTGFATNSTILAFDTTVPASVSVNATGSASVASRRDHVHTGARIATGSYTGDGENSQGITGVGFTPQWMRIDRSYTDNETTAQSRGANIQTYTTVINDNGQGMSITGNDGSQEFWTYLPDGIRTLDSDGFTIGDGGTSDHPNADSVVYNFVCIG